MKRVETYKIDKYSRMLDEIAWYNNGDIMKLAKLAKELNRNYTEDLAERKKLLIDNLKVNNASLVDIDEIKEIECNNIDEKALKILDIITNNDENSIFHHDGFIYKEKIYLIEEVKKSDLIYI